MLTDATLYGGLDDDWKFCMNPFIDGEFTL
jgi:hypothetical protein